MAEQRKKTKEQTMGERNQNQTTGSELKVHAGDSPAWDVFYERLAQIVARR